MVWVISWGTLVDERAMQYVGETLGAVLTLLCAHEERQAPCSGWHLL